MEPKLPPTKQDWYDENRSLYKADSTEAPNEVVKCEHDKKHLVVKGQDVECSKCLVGWPGLAKHFTLLKELQSQK